MSDGIIKVLVVESDPESLRLTVELLHRNSLISSIETASNSEDAIVKLIDFSPDIIFMEYPVIGKLGGKFSKYLKSNLPGATLIYISESKDYAVHAIHDGVFNFLIKPLEQEKADNILQKRLLDKGNNIQERINKIIDRAPKEIKLKFQTSKGYLLIKPDEILFCKASSFYSEIYLTDDKSELCFQLLSKIEETLAQYNFIRISRSALINSRYIRRISRADSVVILSSGGKEYEVKGSKAQIKNLCKQENE